MSDHTQGIAMATSQIMTQRQLRHQLPGQRRRATTTRDQMIIRQNILPTGEHHPIIGSLNVKRPSKFVKPTALGRTFKTIRTAATQMQYYGH
jgi:hypothetical protein